MLLQAEGAVDVVQAADQAKENGSGEKTLPRRNSFNKMMEKLGVN